MEPVIISSVKLQVQLRQSKLIFERKTTNKIEPEKCQKKRPRKKKRKPLQKSASKPTINDCRQHYDISESAHFCSTVLWFFLTKCLSVSARLLQFANLGSHLRVECFSVKLTKVCSVMSNLLGRFFSNFCGFLTLPFFYKMIKMVL